MKKLSFLFATAFFVVVNTTVSCAETNSAPTAATEHKNSALVPVSRTGTIVERQTLVLNRAKENQGECDVVFIGDSITQGWETRGKDVWEKYYGKRKALNIGVSGDRTQHVLWRFEQGQLDGLKPKAAVLMIGTNNSNKDDNSDAEILEGVQEIVKQIREKLPNTHLILMDIFPRGQTFSTQRGKILQVNEVLAKDDSDPMITYVDIGPQLIEKDGSISKEMMPDFLHPGEKGYEIWASAIEPKLKEILAK